MIDFFTTLLNIAIAIVLLLVKLILAPIDAFIQLVLPAFSDGITAIAEYFELASTYLAWIVDATGIPNAAFLLIIGYFLIKLTLPLNLMFIKIVINWYKTLKP